MSDLIKSLRVALADYDRQAEALSKGQPARIGGPLQAIMDFSRKIVDQVGLTSEERRVLDLLAQVWNAFTELPIQHGQHQQEMSSYIHAAQRMVMSRPTSRLEGWVQPPVNHPKLKDYTPEKSASDLAEPEYQRPQSVFLVYDGGGKKQLLDISLTLETAQHNCRIWKAVPFDAEWSVNNRGNWALYSYHIQHEAFVWFEIVECEVGSWLPVSQGA